MHDFLCWRECWKNRLEIYLRKKTTSKTQRAITINKTIQKRI